MTYNFKDQFVNNLKNTNIYIACFTTSHARLMLYDKLDYLKDKVLYFIQIASFSSTMAKRALKQVICLVI